MNTFEVKGTIVVKIINNTLEIIDKIEKEEKVIVYDLISGLEFCEMVELGHFIPYDGIISSIIVDGYKTNIGLDCFSREDGYAVIDLISLKSLSKQNKILINWANK